MDKYLSINAILSKFSKNYMEQKKGLPVRPSEMGVINIITGTEGPHTPVILAEMLGVSKPMITAHITSLENKGYITKKPSSKDKRVYYILPTAKAEALAKSAKADTQALLNRLADTMGQADFEEFVRLANEANRILENKGE